MFTNKIGVLSKSFEMQSKFIISFSHQLRMVNWKPNNEIYFGSKNLDELLIMSQFHEQDIQKREAI